jgi:hypothetical protein
LRTGARLTRREKLRHDCQAHGGDGACADEDRAIHEDEFSLRDIFVFRPPVLQSRRLPD